MDGSPSPHECVLRTMGVCAMDLLLPIMLGLIGLTSNVAGLLVARKQWSDAARGRFFRLFVALAVLAFILTTWQVVHSHQSGQEAKEEAKKDPAVSAHESADNQESRRSKPMLAIQKSKFRVFGQIPDVLVVHCLVFIA